MADLALVLIGVPLATASLIGKGTILGPFQAERDSKRSVGNILYDWMGQKGSVMTETLIPGLRLSKLFPMSKNFQTLLMGKKKNFKFLSGEMGCWNIKQLR